MHTDSMDRDDDPADGWFPESVAAGYDDPGGANAAEVVDPAVEVLAELADGGPVLEFAVGTGRIAAPLAARGVSVSGIELSRAMASRITEKPGGEASARESYDESVRAMAKKGRTVKVELLSRPVGPWGVVDSAEAS